MAQQYDVNNVGGANGGAEAMFLLKELLKLCGWDVVSSSDGVTYNAAGDQITHAGAGANGMNVSRAWFRIRAPAAMAPRREFCFQRGSTGETTWWLKYSAEDTFIGGAPDATNMPTAGDEANLWGSTTAGTAFFPVAATYKIDVVAEDAAPYGWWFDVRVNGTGVCRTALVFDPLVTGTYPALDQDPALIYSNYQAGSDVFAVIQVGAEATGPWGWFTKDIAGETFVHYPGLTYNTGSGSAQAIPVTGTNPYNGYDDHFPIPYARRSAIAQPSWKGFGSVIRWLNTTRANGDTLSTAGVRNRIVLGGCVLPWPDVIPVI